MTVHTLKQCRPDQEETEYFWKLFHAAQRNDARWHGSEISIIADELSRTDLDRNQKLFLLRSWQVLVDDKGGFGRFMGAFDTYVYNMQDPDDDCVAWKPELAQILNDGNCFDVLLDAYHEAQQRIAELEAKLETADRLQDSAFRDGLKAGFSYGQTDDQSGFTQCMSAYNTTPASLLPDGLIRAVHFYEQVKHENPPVETGAWKDAIDWVLKEACLAASTLESSREHKVISQQEKA
ncbi:TPA: hypothetical protein ACJH2U_002108 [Salmonella enterica subsp. enterica serovar Saintpaul]|nr:hypothetical protein [Salmonella enterica subsp. enterica serovar Saintpaul]ECY3259930.1 hypothetical protein [Salmonella enterica subsp. enterica serovar Saintpaul]